MIRIVFYKDSRTEGYLGIAANGHAGYAAAGSDIVCASVSTVIQYAASLLERLDDSVISNMQEDYARFTICMPDGHLHDDSKHKVMDELEQFMCCIAEQYRDYVRVEEKIINKEDALNEIS